ncbi:MAG: ABC transporter permease [Syntrophobacteraceae bacterium]
MELNAHINLLLMAAQNLRRYRAKSYAVMIPLTIAMTICSFIMFGRGGFVKDAESAKSFLPDIIVQGLEAGRVAKAPPDVKDGIEALPHVKKVVRRVWGYIPLKIEGEDRTYTLMGLDLENMVIQEQLPWALESGSFLLQGDKNKAVLGNGVASGLGLATGDRIHIEDTLGNKGEFEIVGVLNSTVQIYSTDLILIPIQDARAFFGYKAGEASDLLVYTDNPENADKTAWRISTAFTNTRVMTGTALTNLVKEAFGRRGGTFQAMWLILLLTVLLLVWAQSAHISVDTARETGILKAMGWHTGEIIEMHMWESLLLGLSSTAVGVLLGFVYALMGTPGISGYCIGCASIYPKFPVPVHCDISSLALLFVVGVVPLTAVSALPAWLSGVIDADRAIRQ